MKLLKDNEEEHHLPDAPRTARPWYVRLAKRGLTKLFSPKGITVSLGVLLVFALTGMISLNYLDVSRDIDKNGISLKDFYAESRMEVVDEEATQRKIDRARQSIQPIYQDRAPHNQDIMEGLAYLLEHLGVLARDPDMPVVERRAKFLDLVGGVPDAEIIFNRNFREPMSTGEWEDVASLSRRSMEAILKKGFTEADDQLRRDAVIRENLPRYGWGRTNRDLIFFIVDATLQPNLILDEKAMAVQQAEVAARITQHEPEIRVYDQGQKIVGQGDKVTPVQRAALERMGKVATNNNWIAVLGVFLLSMLFVFTLWSYLYSFKDRQYFRPSYAGLVGMLTLLTVSLFHMHAQGLLDELVPIYALPLATYGLTLSIFMHASFGILATTLVVFLVALTISHENASSLAAMLFGSYMGVYVLSKRIQYSDRGQLWYAGLYVGATNALILIAVNMLKPVLIGADPLPALVNLLLWGFASGVFSGILTMGVLKPLENLFRLVTPYTLAELGNHNQPLLKRMQFEAPGTFHHSLMVATLAETAAESIGADALLTRVGCLYHDIGKMKRPLFFIENQAYFGVENPHDKLTPRLSKMVITAHPRDSIEMAKQHKLPDCLMKFMTEHHGTLTAGYFYNKACIEEGVENVNKSQFRYPGPKPGSKETAIVMLADACESAVRALKTPTVAQVEERIDKIIQQRIEDGQFDNCPLTFQDISAIKQTFVRVLRGIQHNRIEYQQNMMRELGRKMPGSTAADHAHLQEALTQAQNKPDKTAGQGPGQE